MKRKLHDALMQQVEAGLIVPDECGIIRSQYCFKSRWSDVEKLEASVAEKILAFHQLAEIFGLPTHNAVAFFTRAFEKQVPPEEMDAFRKLICLAIAGRGFLFGTTFDRERNSNLRPCDLPMKGWMESNHFPLNLGALRNQAALKSAAYFEQDYCMCEKDTVRRLEQQRAVFVEWKQLAEDLKLHKCTYPFKLEAKNILSFFHIYTRYSLMQLRNQEIVTATAQETRRVKNELKELRQVSLLLMQLHRFRQKADELLGLEEDAEFSKGKKEWINKFLTYINRKRTIDAAKIAEKIVDRDNELATNIAGELEIIRNIAKAGLNETTRKKYPILDPMSMARKLNRTETKLLNAYREHPMYRCYAELKRYLETPPIAAIAPYYLTYWFIHKKNPQIPFKKWQYKFTSKHTEINLRVSVSNDDRVHYYQACNYYLFQELCAWWTNIENSQPTIYLHNQMLCEALYARCRHQVVKQEWLRIGTRPSGMGNAQEGIYQIYQQLDGIFDFTAFPFPIYAKTMNHIDDLMYYFYDKQDDNVRKAKRYIQKMLTEQDVEEYKERMFIGEDGAGKSIMPIEWHERIAEWLEKMIGKNLFVSKYVEGNPDPYYPGSSVRLSEIDKAIEYFDEKERIYPEDLQPYLAFVEWYIQKVCCERICADMQPKVLSFCKRIFLEI